MNHLRRTLFALFAFSITWPAAAPAARAADDRYDVGVAKVDVTPAYPVRLNGFGFRREEFAGVTQPIWVKALAIGSDESGPAILFTIDSLGVREVMIDQVAARLAEKAGIKRERIAATFTHSHTTPKLNGVCDTIFSTPIPPEHQVHIDRYNAEMAAALEKAALDALANRRPSRLQWAVGKVGFAANRRTAGGPVDHSLPVLVVRSADDDSLRAVYATYACHCVTLSDNKISGDWAGFAQQAIERQHPGVIALVSIGCGSDANPASGVTGDDTAAAAEQGGEIADEVERLLAAELKPVAGALAAKLNHIDLPLNPPPDRAALERLAAEGGPAGYNAGFQLARIARGEPLLAKLDYPIQTWAFGDSLAMVFLAGEVCVDYSLRLKAELDPERIWLHGYSNDFCAYIPSERLLKEGGYGGGGEVVYFALPNTIAPGLEEKIVAEVHQQVPQFEGAGPRGDRGRQPWPIDEAVASIRVKPGFVVEVAAAEPLVADPVAIDFGSDGRMWVADMTDYTSAVDGEFTQTGSVRLLTDRDGDGRYDESSVFQDRLRFPTDVKAWRDGVIVCDAPDVIYLEDTNGDQKADVRKVLLTGFETHNAQARVNSLRWGLDNWVYGSCGIFGGKIKTAAGKTVALSSRDFRFRPDTGELEAVTGCTQQGRDRNDWGDWFGCENGTLVDYYPLVDHYLARNPNIVPPTAELSIITGNDPSQLHPLISPMLFLLSGPPGRPTAACGLGVYRDELLGADYANNVFVAESVNHLVHRRVLAPQGASFNANRADDERDVEFLASTDPWFRPVQIRTGLDGCLYVIDMHREVIEHPKFIPEESLRQLDLMGGRDQGRILRVRRADRPLRQPARLDQLAGAELVAALDSPNGPQRDLVQEMLVTRQAVDTAPALKALARTSQRPATRMQALCTLEGLKSLDATLLTAALADDDPRVRRHAIRLSEPFAAKSPELTAALITLADDPDGQVQVQLAYSLGELDAAGVAPALARIAWLHRDDPYVLSAVWSSVDGKNVGPVVQQLLELAGGEDIPPEVVEPAVNLVAKLGSAENVADLAAAIGAGVGERPASWRLLAAAKLLEQREVDFIGMPAGTAAKWLKITATSERLLSDGGGEESDQLLALRILLKSGADRDHLLSVAEKLLGPQASPAVQQAAIDFIASIASAESGQVILNHWREFTAATRARAFNALVGRPPLLASLLAGLDAGTLQATDFDALQRERLLTHGDETVRQRAVAALAGDINADRQRIVDEYTAAELPGDLLRGQQKFAKNCSSCHRINGQGHDVGPDLAAITNRTRTALIQSILDPNRVIEENYRNYKAITVDGLAHAGILATETSTSVTLVEQEGKQQTLLRSELDLLENTGRSLMPEGFERDLSTQDLNDVCAFLNSVARAPKVLAGNKPAVVTSDYQGALWLLAANAEVFGKDITFEALHHNLGFWHDELDHADWKVTLDRGGEYDVYLRWSCAASSAGSALVIEGANPPLRWKTFAMGEDYETYKTQRIGRVKLFAGEHRIVVRPDGPLSQRNLFDLYGVFLFPADQDPERLLAAEPAGTGDDAANSITRLLIGLEVGTPREYDRIPAIWEAAIAAGKRNDAKELLRVVDQATPAIDAPLADWQAVVLGGGVINGISQVGQQPERRLGEVLAGHAELQARWARAIELAAKMADDRGVREGTRYDALRMLGVKDLDVYGAILLKYLAADASAELQMGAVSALADIGGLQATAALVKSFPGLAEENRRIAVAGLLALPEGANQLKEAIAANRIAREQLKAEELARLDASDRESAPPPRGATRSPAAP